MIQTVIMEADTPARLTLKLNDWLKHWPEDKIMDIQYVFKKGSVYPYSSMVIYRK